MLMKEPTSTCVCLSTLLYERNYKGPWWSNNGDWNYQESAVQVVLGFLGETLTHWKLGFSLKGERDSILVNEEIQCLWMRCRSLLMRWEGPFIEARVLSYMECLGVIILESLLTAYMINTYLEYFLIDLGNWLSSSSLGYVSEQFEPFLT